MKITTLPYSATNSFSKLVTDYLAEESHLKPFLNRFPTLENFGEQIKERANFPKEQRQILVKALEKQYENVAKNPAVELNIASLQQDKTFTVTTGHQLNIFTGPLYFVYKIVSAIKTCRELKKAYPENEFVPVYWMATEDHDFAEINHFNLFGKTYEWQTEQRGAVGRMRPDGLEKVLEELPEKFPVFEKAYRESQTLAEATRKIVNELFGEYGLVVLDGDEPELKKTLIPVLLNEFSDNTSYRLVNQTNETLAAFYKPQVLAREINLFYLEKDLRERIVEEGDKFSVLNTDLAFSKEEIKKLAQVYPEKFSPNVILRPLYQEMLLPDLAYIGGGAEVAYWLQLKAVFEHYSIPFPIIMLRNSAMYVNKANGARMQKLGLKADDLFEDLQALKKQVSDKLELPVISLEAQKHSVSEAFAEVENLARTIEPTLEKAVAAEAQKVQNVLQMLEKKIAKAQETKHETVFKQLTALKEKLFPGDGLQERSDNFLSFQANNPGFITDLLQAFEPLNNRFVILEEEV
ncbi:bacillithiol biosynthesis cysteine-adding enzyme BshC [Adhaeribacter sp. BT258]|uniref:Putative cysteine ligase BshC n=1 Tax=Adhaeribacter terrigena TaxID=2793070 RepID=A0ABS1C274_9BACT|nr:bacillithiol biosynthesis cysteine-adding enzyme BshC [Adhaeribacter terrigena]MBK0403282.1 bacillithiol biosynthesis cysteine-adding enzyme BshC [Adhaeribacter terrigena]